jgi:hypothetical protein
MEIKLQTQVTEQNRAQFYQTLYSQQLDSKQQLIDLEKFSNECILVDCCGWHYRNLFPHKKIIALETFKTAKQFKLGLDQFDKLIDDQSDQQITWPDLHLAGSALIFDRSPILKYRSIGNLSSTLNSAVDRYNAKHLILNTSTTFIDDHRLTDRFYNMVEIRIPNFTVREFAYNTSTNKLLIQWTRNHDI